MGDELEDFLAGHEPMPEEATLRPGDVVGDWRVTAFLGRGGSSEVHRVEHVKLGTVAALKLALRPGEARFLAEEKFLASNRTDYFPRFFNTGLFSGRDYFVIELLEPMELPHTDRAVARYLCRVAKALGVLHAKGLVHRDLKPLNIMRRANGEAVLIDLGLVDGATNGGTRAVASPEQLRGEKVGPMADIHALGLLADECFDGVAPRCWVKIIDRATNSIPGHRYASARAFATAVKRRHCPFWSRLGAVALVLASGLLIRWAWPSGEGKTSGPTEQELASRAVDAHIAAVCGEAIDPEEQADIREELDADYVLGYRTPEGFRALLISVYEDGGVSISDAFHLGMRPDGMTWEGGAPCASNWCIKVTDPRNRPYAFSVDLACDPDGDDRVFGLPSDACWLVRLDSDSGARNMRDLEPDAKIHVGEREAVALSEVPTLDDRHLSTAGICYWEGRQVRLRILSAPSVFEGWVETARGRATIRGVLAPDPETNNVTGHGCAVWPDGHIESVTVR